jgi:hypothetical protein
MKKHDLHIRTATAGDIHDFYGGGVPYTSRAWVVEVGGVPACVAGAYRANGVYVAFSCMKQGMDLPKMTIWRGALMLMDKIASMNVPVLAIPESGFVAAPAFLKRLGFVEAEPVKEGMVYRWHRQ